MRENINDPAVTVQYMDSASGRRTRPGAGRRLEAAVVSDNWSAPLDQTDQNQNDGGDEQDVDETAYRV
jgi:hypothetical protein